MMMMAVPGKQSSQNGLIKDVLHTDPRESRTLCVRIRFGLPSQGPGKWDPVLTRAKNMFKNVPEYQTNTPCHFIDLRVPGLRSKRERDWAQPRRSVWAFYNFHFLSIL